MFEWRFCGGLNRYCFSPWNFNRLNKKVLSKECFVVCERDRLLFLFLFCSVLFSSFVQWAVTVITAFAHSHHSKLTRTPCTNLWLLLVLSLFHTHPIWDKLSLSFSFDISHSALSETTSKVPQTGSLFKQAIFAFNMFVCLFVWESWGFGSY